MQCALSIRLSIRCGCTITRDVIRCGAVRNVKRESFEVRRKGRWYWSDRYVFHDDIPLLTGQRIVVPLHAHAISTDCNYRERRVHDSFTTVQYLHRNRRYINWTSVNTSAYLATGPRLRSRSFRRREGKRCLDHLITLVGARYKPRAKWLTYYGSPLFLKRFNLFSASTWVTISARQQDAAALARVSCLRFAWILDVILREFNRALGLTL